MTAVAHNPSNIQGNFLNVFHVQDGEDGKAVWKQIGIAFGHTDGKGFNIKYLVHPPEGARIVVRPPSTKKPALQN